MRLFVFAILIISTLHAALPEPVRIDSGPLEGIPSSVPGVIAFEGIPYAAPPVGGLRWKEPQPAPAWPVVRNADRFMPACPQHYMGPDSTAFFGDYEPKSEDCLYLNIWTSAKASSDKLPVLVWIHGGGFRVGSGAERLHHGEHLAAKGVVLVTFNYRLGVFGFLAHPELTGESAHNASGNYGLMDQVAALEWVKRNIAAFGGDPQRVTIFGESAGAGSVSYMQATPLAKDLFQGAIGESGGSFSGRNVSHLSAAEQNGVKFATEAGATSLAELRKKPAEDLLSLSIGSASPGGGAYPFTPIVDGYVIPQDVYLIFAEGKQNRVPVLVGSNSDEGTTLRIPRATFTDVSDQAKSKVVYPDGTDAQMVSGGMLWAARTWASLVTKSGEKAYQYYFSHGPPYPKDQPFARDVTKLGAHHSAEIIYVFDNLDIRKSRDWPYTPWDRKLADTMSTYWVNFAAHGDPNGKGLPKWPAYRDSDTQVMNFGEKIEPIALPRQAELLFWDEANLRSYKKPAPLTDAPYTPQPILPGGVVVPLYPSGSPMLHADRVREPEVYNMSQSVPGRVSSIVNIHNPSIEAHFVERSINTGAAVILVAGGGHNTLNVGSEAADFVPFFYNYGVNTIILRNRLRKDGYSVENDAVNDALQAVRLVRENAEKWNLDPHKIGMMGFSAGAELVAAAAVLYPEFDLKSKDTQAAITARPDFVGIVYPGPSPFAHGRVAPPIPRDVPPAFVICGGTGDRVHAVWAMEYVNAMLAASVPNVELHIYGNGRHPGDALPDGSRMSGGLTDRNNIPLGTWQLRFIDWFRDLGFLQKPGVETKAARDIAGLK